MGLIQFITKRSSSNAKYLVKNGVGINKVNWLSLNTINSMVEN